MTSHKTPKQVAAKQLETIGDHLIDALELWYTLHFDGKAELAKVFQDTHDGETLASKLYFLSVDIATLSKALDK